MQATLDQIRGEAIASLDNVSTAAYDENGERDGDFESDDDKSYVNDEILEFCQACNAEAPLGLVSATHVEAGFDP